MSDLPSQPQHASAPSADSGLGSRVRRPSNRLGDMLIEEGVISQSMLAEALNKQAKEGGFLGKTLVELGYVDQKTLTTLLVKQCKIPHISLLDYGVSEALAKMLPREFCLKYRLLPIDKMGKILTVAMVDPLDLEALEQIRAQHPELHIKPILCNWDHFDAVVRKLLPAEGGATEGEMTMSSLGLNMVSKPKPAPVPEAPAVSAPAPPAGPTAPMPPSADVDSVVQQLVRENSTAATSAPAPAPVTAPHTLDATVQTALTPLVDQLVATQDSGEGAAAKVAEHLSQNLRESLKEVVKDAVHTLAESNPSPAPVVSPEVMAATVHESIDSAMTEAVSKLHEVVKDAAQHETQVTKEAFHESMAGIIRESVGGAMQQAVAQLIEATAKAPAKPSLSAEDLSTTIRESVGAIMNESFAKLAERIEQTAPVRVAANVEPFPRQAERRAAPTMARALDGATDRAQGDERIRKALEQEQAVHSFSFAQFVPGTTNQFAFNVFQAIAQSPGAEFTPLYVHSAPGLGKTHLLHAVAHEVTELHPDARVLLVNASRFIQKTEEASGRKSDELKLHYCLQDVFLLDDLHQIRTSARAQEELISILELLEQEGRQIVLSGAEMPDRLGLMPALTSRISAGVVIGLQPPDFEARLAILEQTADTLRAGLSGAILEVVARRVTSDVRRLNGALRKLLAFAKLGQQELTAERTEEVLTSLGITDAA